MPPKRRALDAFQKAAEDLQALGRQALLFWLYYLTARRMQVEASMRSKGELPGAPASAAADKEGLGEVDGL